LNGFTYARQTLLQVRARNRRYRPGIAYLFLSPWVVGALVLTVAPMLVSLYLSFTDYDLFTTPEWVGLDNYRRLFTEDDRSLSSARVTATYVLARHRRGHRAGLAGDLHGRGPDRPDHGRGRPARLPQRRGELHGAAGAAPVHRPGQRVGVRPDVRDVGAQPRTSDLFLSRLPTLSGRGIATSELKG
jgi:hypothetical protein